MILHSGMAKPVFQKVPGYDDSPTTLKAPQTDATVGPTRMDCVRLVATTLCERTQFEAAAIEA